MATVSYDGGADIDPVDVDGTLWSEIFKTSILPLGVKISETVRLFDGKYRISPFSERQISSSHFTYFFIYFLQEAFLN